MDSQRTLGAECCAPNQQGTGSFITSLLLEGIVLEGWECTNVSEAICDTIKGSVITAGMAVSSCVCNLLERSVLDPRDAERLRLSLLERCVEVTNHTFPRAGPIYALQEIGWQPAPEHQAFHEVGPGGRDTLLTA